MIFILFASVKNIIVDASTNTVSCTTYDVPDEVAQLNYNNRRYNYNYNSYNNPPPAPLYSYGVCDKIKLGRGVTLQLAKPKIKYILFRNSHIGTIPPRIFQDYSSLEAIYLNDSNVREIDLNAFFDLRNLKELYLQNNKLTDIGKGIYNNLQNLQILDLSNNQINTIEGKALHGLIRLQNLNISYNQIQNISLDIFDSELNSMHSLNLSHNLLLEIDLKIISKLFSANSISQQIDLSYNAIKSFNFSHLTCNLSKLNLRNNNLSTLIDLQHAKTINDLDLSYNNISEFNYTPANIKYLNLRGNVLKNLNISLLSDKVEIKTLDVSQNLIEYLKPDTFYNMSTLTNLNLANNKLTELPIGVFKNVTLLTSLNLSGNELQQFEYGTFSGLESLTELDISNNSFYSLDAKTFYILTNLITLNIANNKLTTLNPYNILNHCSKIKVVIINNNPWSCESLLNFSSAFRDYKVKVPNGQNWNIINHFGHPCNVAEKFLVTETSVITYDYSENKINSLEKTIDTEFKNSSLLNRLFEDYKNKDAHAKLETLNDYFNKDFKDTEFYKFFNKNFSNNYEGSLRNFTDTLNLINSKFSQTESNFGKLDQAIVEFSNFFDTGFEQSSFYEYFDKNFTNLMKSLNINLENSFDKFLVSKSIESDVDQVFSQNISYAKLIDDVLENRSIEDEIVTLRIFFILFTSILIILLFIITLLLFLLLRKFLYNGGKQIIINGESAELQLV